MAKKKAVKQEPVEIVEAMPIADFKPGICVCGHDQSSHNGINKSCARFLDADHGDCPCLGFVQAGMLEAELADG